LATPAGGLYDPKSGHPSEVANVARYQRRIRLQADTGLHRVADVNAGSGGAQLTQERAGKQRSFSRQHQTGSAQQRVDRSGIPRVAAAKRQLERGHGGDPEARPGSEFVNQLAAGTRVAQVIDQDV
jgi:hypothetical protein